MEGYSELDEIFTQKNTQCPMHGHSLRPAEIFTAALVYSAAKLLRKIANHTRVWFNYSSIRFFFTG